MITLVVVVAWVAGVLAVAGPALAVQPVDEVHYTFTSQTSVSIDWRGDANDVRWGPTTSYGSTATGTPPQWTPWSSAGPFWQLQLSGLAPGATYHYSIAGGPDWTFHTPPTGSFRFDAIGDVGSSEEFSKLGDTLSSIAGDDPSFVLMVGDLTYANATGVPINVIDQHFNDVMNSWGTSAAYIPAWGNHEYDVPGSDDLRNYKGRLMMPNAQASPGSPDISCCGDDWGWFDAGPVRFISYPEPWTGAWANWQSQASTLMSQAQNDPTIKYVITYGHRPAYSTGFHLGEAQLANILDGFGSSYSKYVLNINGHSHDYERFQPIQGVTHVTVGAPSSLETPWSTTDARTAFRAFHLSHLRVDVSDTGLRLQAVCDDSASKEDTTCPAGSVMDEYTIGAPPVTPPKTQYYVDNTVSSCSDTGPGTQTQPFCTITKGVGRMQPGYTLFIGNGTYNERVKPTVSGTASAPITITAWPGRSPVIGTPGMTNGVYLSALSYIVVSNLVIADTVGDGIYVTKSNHITVSGNHVSGSGRPLQSQTAPGISLRATNSSTVVGNVSDRNNGHGIYVTNTSTGNAISDNEASLNAEGWQRNANGIDVTAPGNSVLRNVTHDNEDSGINFYTGADNSLAALNVTYNNGDHGIDDLNVSGGRIIGNTVFHNCTSGINVEGTSTNYLVENNVAVDNAVYPAYNGISCSRRAGNIGIWDSAPASTTVDHNLVHLSKSGVMYAFKSTYTSLAAMQAATGQERSGVQGDPRFLDASTAQFQLTEGSPAIDRGDSGVADEPTHDILGNARVDDVSVANTFAGGPRAYDDLGAFEFQPDVAPAPDPPTARLTVSPASGTSPVQVTADASGSTDPQGQALSYAFDFGDGTVVGPQTTPTATHTYASAGTYTVTLTATDTSGLSATATQTVMTSAPPSAPTAQLSVSPSAGVAPVQVTADASASTDPQGQTLTYSFDFGDGTTTGAQAASSAVHTYLSPGSYPVTVTATDTSGLSDAQQQTVTVAAPPTAPTARLSASPSSGTAPVAVTADASASSDPQGQALTYAFDFGDGTTTGPGAEATATHTYTTAGTVTISVTVTDSDGLSSTASQDVAVSPALLPPTARLTVSPSSGTAALPVTADASASTDPQGESLSYAFDFGDGTATGATTSSTANHTYTVAGTYQVTVSTTDTSGLSDTTRRTVTVDPAPPPPTAALSVTPLSGTAPVLVTADASGSTDPRGESLSYAFDFGDGTTTGPQASATATHTFTAAGTYAVKVTVTDTSGLSDTTRHDVQVTAPPTARLSVSPTSGQAPLQVTADASSSTDPQGQTLSYAFDFGDGTTTGSQASPTATHTYSAIGSYRVTVTVTDTSGLSDTSRQDVTVNPTRPAAQLSVTPSSGTAPTLVTADASGSTDPQGQTLTYAFDFGDGTTTGPQTSPSATHTFSAGGTYTVKVIVTDTSGLSSSATKSVSIAAPAPPTARLSVSPTTGTTPVLVTADASASTDPQGQALSYAFDFGDGTTTTGTSTPTATHTYSVGGTYAVKVTITDTAGLSSSATQSVTVTNAPGFVGEVGTATSTASSRTGVLTTSSAVKAGDVVVLSVQSGTGASKPVTATDDSGTKYTLGTSRSDTTGAELSVLYGVTTKALPAGSRITVAFPTSTSYRVSADALTGVKTLDRTAISTGRTSTFSSGATKTTAAAREVVMGVVATTNAGSAPGWAGGWTPTATLAATTSYVGRAYRLPTATGIFTASGATTGTWTAAVLTFRP